jgi:hypothetical protein
MKDRHVTNTIRENYVTVSVSFENYPSQAEQKQEIQHEHKGGGKKKAATEEKYKNAP